MEKGRQGLLLIYSSLMLSSYLRASVVPLLFLPNRTETVNLVCGVTLALSLA
jgi:hypothetical protein